MATAVCEQLLYHTCQRTLHPSCTPVKWLYSPTSGKLCVVLFSRLCCIEVVLWLVSFQCSVCVIEATHTRQRKKESVTVRHEYVCVAVVCRHVWKRKRWRHRTHASFASNRGLQCMETCISELQYLNISTMKSLWTRDDRERREETKISKWAVWRKIYNSSMDKFN